MSFEGETTNFRQPIVGAYPRNPETDVPMSGFPDDAIDRNQPAFDSLDILAGAVGTLMMLAPLAVTAWTGGA